MMVKSNYNFQTSYTTNQMEKKKYQTEIKAILFKEYSFTKHRLISQKVTYPFQFLTLSLHFLLHFVSRHKKIKKKEKKRQDPLQNQPLPVSSVSGCF